MRRLPHQLALFCGAILALAWGSLPAQAGFVATETSSAIRQSSGLYLYTYTVQVAANSTIPMSEFDLAFAGDLNAGSISIVAPIGFTYVYSPLDPTAGSTLSFYATDNGTSTVGLGAGTTGVFSFLSAYTPGAGSYYGSGYDASFNFGSISGAAVTPNAIPEPSSLLLSGLGLGGLTIGRRVRSRRTAVA